MIGLNEKEVEEARLKYGTNKITNIKKNTFIHLLLESFGDPIIKILLIALAIKVIVLFKDFDFFETIGILIAVFLATFISTISEYGSEKAFRRLQSNIQNSKVKVLRDKNIVEIYEDDVVMNDIIVLHSGDKIPADGYLVKGNITVDESTLNGESRETLKTSVKEGIKEENKVYRGTVIYNGDAYMKVSAIGDETLLGKISQELQEEIPESPLRTRLRDLARIISRIGYLGAILASITYLFASIVIANDFDLDLIIVTLKDIPLMFDYLLYALTLSVTIIVVAVPEGLPMMITLVLSSNMNRMLKDNVLVRKLVGIETSGRINILFTDKTGTLTKGILSVGQYITADFAKFRDIADLKEYPIYNYIYSNLYYNNSSYITNNTIIGGNATDRAVLSFVKGDSFIKKEVLSKDTFDSTKKYSSVYLNDGFYYIKGAMEVILPKCHSMISRDGKIVTIDREKITKYIKEYTKKGSRVIVLAYGKNKDELIYLGFLNIKDELRSEATQAIKLIKSAGINPIMITGDSVDTAISIAREVGLLNKEQYIVLTSKDLSLMSDEEVKRKLKNMAVIARSLPQDKSRLVSIAEDMGLVVGMTGDGVNDAPALKKANVGFAIGSGTEVAKSAADIVILDDNILSITKAIIYGRTIFKSIRKFIIYQLTVNMTALILSIIGSLIGVSTPITIVQMLWLNMIMDTFSGIAFSFEVPLREYMEESPEGINTSIMNRYMYNQIIITGLYCASLCILFLKLPIFQNIIRYSSTSKYLMTAYFAMFIFMGIFNAFNARTTRINIFANILKNKVFIIIFLFIFIVQIYIIYNGGNIFRTYGLTLNELLLSLGLALTVFPVDILRKYIYKRKYGSIEL